MPPHLSSITQRSNSRFTPKTPKYHNLKINSVFRSRRSQFRTSIMLCSHHKMKLTSLSFKVILPVWSKNQNQHPKWSKWHSRVKYKRKRSPRISHRLRKMWITSPWLHQTRRPSTTISWALSSKRLDRRYKNSTKTLPILAFKLKRSIEITKIHFSRWYRKTSECRPIRDSWVIRSKGIEMTNSNLLY